LVVFSANVPATIHYGATSVSVPGEVLFDEQTVPQSEAPFVAVGPDGGPIELQYLGKVPCAVTAPRGQPLKIVNVSGKMHVAAGGGQVTELTLELSPLQ
jgi:hypothetical protein